MLKNSNNDWQPPPDERLLYSYHRAIDEVLELGAIPVRLFNIFYPIWRVHIEGRQRISRNYEDVEHFIERGIDEVGLRTVGDLSAFYGLDADYVHKLVEFLHSIGHIQRSQERLQLTQLGVDSVKEGIFFEEHETSSVLFFDGLESRPLSLAHYNIPIYTEPPDDQYFYCLDLFSRDWNDTELKRIHNLPERQDYDLPDVITRAQLMAREPAYLPIYVVHCRFDKQARVPSLLVFSRIRGRRDSIIEEVINQDAVITPILLREDSRAEKVNAVMRRMESFGLTLSEWELIEDSQFGMQVMAASRVFTHRGSEDISSENTELTVDKVGQYLLAYEWCIWLSCDDPDIRHRAVIEQLLNWLQHTHTAPSTQAYHDKIASLCERLETVPVSQNTLMKQAKTLGYGRALTRLDTLVED